MIEFLCHKCKKESTFHHLFNICNSVSIYVEPCHCEEFKDCDNCDKITEIKEEIIVPLNQANIDIEGLDKIIRQIRKYGQSMGGVIETSIEKILEGD